MAQPTLVTRAHPELEATLHSVLPELRRLCRDPWCVIGSAAAWIVGAHVSVADVDLLTSVDDADRLEAHWAPLREETYAPEGAERFRSRFSRYQFAQMPVEVMGGLQLNPGDGWQPVRVGEVVNATWGELTVPIPSFDEQLRILESFGRPKDLYRAGLLRNLLHQ